MTERTWERALSPWRHSGVTDQALLDDIERVFKNKYANPVLKGEENPDLLAQRDALLEACEGLIFSGERMHLGEGRIELWELAIGRAKAAIAKARESR